MAEEKRTAKEWKAIAKPGFHGDGGGLYLSIVKGSRTWMFRYKRAGKGHWMGLGPDSLVSLADARDAAIDARRLLRKGIDPIEHRREEAKTRAAEAASAKTFETVADEFITSHKAGWKNEKHGDQWKATLSYGATPLPPPPAKGFPEETEAERAERQVSMGLLNTNYASASSMRQQSALRAVEGFSESATPPLFPNLPDVLSPRVMPTHSTPQEHLVKYALRTDLGIPAALVREELPNLFDIEADLCPQIAREFCRIVPMTSMLLAVNSNAELSMRDVFNAGQTDQRNLSVRMSAARIAEQAQAQLMFNDGIDPRRIREAVEAELSRLCQKEGIDATSRDLRRTINLAILRQPQSLKEAVRIAQGQHIRLESNEPIPTEQFGVKDAAKAKKGAYGAFIGRFNRPERAFAEMLDNDDTGRIKWWLRNNESEKWATRLILPTGKRFFPDFAVGVSGRRTKDNIALVEIKDDGETGRLHSDSNAIKIRSEHSEYKKVFWSFREAEGVFLKAVWNQSYNRIFSNGPFEIKDMVLIQ